MIDDTCYFSLLFNLKKNYQYHFSFQNPRFNGYYNLDEFYWAFSLLNIKIYHISNGHLWRSFYNIDRYRSANRSSLPVLSPCTTHYTRLTNFLSIILGRVDWIINSEIVCSSVRYFTGDCLQTDRSIARLF